jgi:hypothetical protein
LAEFWPSAEGNDGLKTPNVAGKIYGLLKSSGYTRRTVQDYVWAAVELLELEKREVFASP